MIKILDFSSFKIVMIIRLGINWIQFMINAWILLHNLQYIITGKHENDMIKWVGSHCLIDIAEHKEGNLCLLGYKILQITHASIRQTTLLKIYNLGWSIFKIKSQKTIFIYLMKLLLRRLAFIGGGCFVLKEYYP